MKKITTIICLCILVAAFIFMFVFSVCLPRTEVSDYSILKEWPEFSFESFINGQYLNDIMYCFTDTIHSRDRFIDFETRINDLYGIEDEQKVVVIYPEDEEDVESESSVESASFESSELSYEVSMDASDDSDVSNIIESSESVSSEAEDTSYEESETTDETSQDEVVQVPPELSGSVLIVGTRALEIYGGNQERAAMYAQVLNDFAEKLDNDVKVYSMVIPKASAYYIEQAQGYDNYIYRNKNDIDVITNTLSDKVIDVNIYNILGLHAGEEIYLRTDHHWSALGAYYASSVFAEKAGVAFAPLSEFTEWRREGYVGTMYKFSENNSTLLNNPEDFMIYYPNADYEAYYYSSETFKDDPRSSDKDDDGVQDYNGFFWEIGDNQRSSWYSTFLRGDSYAVKAVSNECKNGRKLLIVKDSYGNALSPFMIEGYEEIYIVDARKYQDSLTDTVEDLGITDVLFAECTFSAVGKDYINALKELCTK